MLNLGGTFESFVTAFFDFFSSLLSNFLTSLTSVLNSINLTSL